MIRFAKICIILAAIFALIGDQPTEASIPMNMNGKHRVQVVDIGASIFDDRYNTMANQRKNLNLNVIFQKVKQTPDYDIYKGDLDSLNSVTLIVNTAGYVSLVRIDGNDYDKVTGMFNCVMNGVGLSSNRQSDKAILVQVVDRLNLMSQEFTWSTIDYRLEKRMLLIEKSRNHGDHWQIKISAFVNDTL